MGFFRAAGRAYGKVNSAVIKATSPRKWRKSVDNYQQGHHDFSKSTNVANLRVSRGKESYDLLIDNDEIHVAYQDKQGKTQWRKAADVGDFTAIDPGKPPSPQGLNRHWANTYKTSGGTYKGFDAKVKYLQDYGYQVAALDKRPYKAWRSGDKKTAESYVQQVESGQRLQGTPEFFGDYIDPKQAHSTADQQYRRRFFQDVSGQSWQQQKGRVWTGSAWRRPPNPPQPPPPTSGPPPVRPTPKGPSAGPSASTGPTTGKQSRINFGGNPPQNPNPGKGWRFSQNQAVVPPHSAVKPPKTASTDLGEGFSLVPRKNAGGQDATVHFADDRVMVRMKDSQGRESWVYRSAHGTSGKEKGRWYPVGGQAKFKYGDKWIIKGDPANDPYYGRPELGKLYEHANKVLPKTDAELDDFINRHTGSDKGYGLHQDSNYQTIPVEFNDLDVFQDRDKTLGSVLNSWKEGYLNKVWGKRETPQAKQLEAPAKTISSREWQYAQNKPIVPPYSAKRIFSRSKPTVSEEKTTDLSPDDIAQKIIGQLEDDRIGVERRKAEKDLADKITAQYGRGKKGVLAESHIVERARNAGLPDFDESDPNPQDLPEWKLKELDRQVQLSKFANKSTTLAANNEPVPGDVEDIYRFTSTPVSGEKKGTTEGKMRKEGALNIANQFYVLADNETDPKIKAATLKQADEVADIFHKLRIQEELKAKGKNAEAEAISQDAYEGKDPQGILELSKPFLGQMPTGATDDIISGIDKSTGQNNKDIKNTKGGKTLYVPDAWKNTNKARPGRTPNIHIQQVEKAEKNQFDEKAAIQYAERSDAIDKKVSAIDKLQKLYSGAPLDQISPPSSPNKNEQQYASSIARLFRDLRERNESLHLLRSGIEPAKQGELRQFETVSDKGQSTTNYESSSPYTDRTAETRLHNASSYPFERGQEIENKWLGKLLSNIPDSIKNIDPNLTRSQRRALIRDEAEKTVAGIFAQHQKNYDNPELENLEIDNIFNSTMGREHGRELLIDKGNENIDLGSDIRKWAATANAIDPQTGKPYGYMNTLYDALKTDSAADSIAKKYNQFDRAKLEQRLAFDTSLLQEDQKNPIYQNVASDSFNAAAAQGVDLPTNVSPHRKIAEQTAEEIYAATQPPGEVEQPYQFRNPELAQQIEGMNLDMMLEKAIDSGILPDGSSIDSLLAMMDDAISARKPQKPAPVSPVEQPLGETAKPLWQMSRDEYLQTPEGQAKWQQASQSVIDDSNAQIAQYSKGKMTQEKRQRIALAQKTISLVQNNQIDGFLWKQIELRALGIGTPEGHREQVTKALQEGQPVPSKVLNDYPDLLANQIDQPPAETPFSLKTPEQPGIGAGRTTGLMFDVDTELDKAARANQYDEIKGQLGLLDQPVETPVVSPQEIADTYTQPAVETSVSRPEIVTDPNVKEVSIPLYNPGTSGLRNVPKGGVLEWLASRQIKAPSTRKFKGGEYDGAEFFPPSTLAKIYSKDNPKAYSPDLAVQSMIAEGVLPESSTVNDMWEAARKEHLEMPRLAEKASQADKFAAQILNSGVKKGRTEVDLGHLDIGETIELGGKGHEEEFTFKGILAPGLEDELNLPRSVINELINEGKEGYVLEDGAKYGLQVVPVENGILKANAKQDHYVSANKQPGDTVLYDGEEWTVEGHDFNNAETVLVKNAKAKNLKRKRVPLRGRSADELAEQYNRQDGGAGDEWTPF